MNKFFTSKYLLLLVIFAAFFMKARAQNSVLVNFGDTACGNPAPPSFSLIKDPLTANSTVLSNCSLAAQLPDFYSVFVAYNPLNQKIYIADTRSGVTKIWALDIGLPANISCPSMIPVTPDYTYTYTSNNFEFDNNGNLYSFSAFDGISGQSHIDKFDVNTGTILSTSILQFPAGNFPSGIYTGDLAILPNGRMFAVLGIPSKLYEITDYTTANATATFLQNIPKNCYGIAYLNGELELTGFDGAGCYHYEYEIGNNSLGAEQPFQNGQTPIDNSSISPTIGVSKQLLSWSASNQGIVTLDYGIYVRNLGNVSLNNISLKDDLGAAFGAANVLSASVSFDPSFPAAVPPGLTLNPGYDGVNDINILNTGAQLPNQTSPIGNYSFKVIVHCTVANLTGGAVYYNSAIGGGSIGNSISGTDFNISDSSNNGNESAVDPNNDSNAGEPGENVPTPFTFFVLPVHFLNIAAVLENKNSALVKWSIATPAAGANAFEPEFSVNGNNWTKLTHIVITDPNRSSYDFLHENIPAGTIYYRVKQIDNNGFYIYSRTVLLHTGSGSQDYAIFPNPANNSINIILPDTHSLHPAAYLYDAIGRLVLSNDFLFSSPVLNCSKLPDGAYFLKIKDDHTVFTQKLIIRH